MSDKNRSSSASDFFKDVLIEDPEVQPTEKAEVKKEPEADKIDTPKEEPKAEPETKQVAEPSGEAKPKVKRVWTDEQRKQLSDRMKETYQDPEKKKNLVEGMAKSKALREAEAKKE